MRLLNTETLRLVDQEDLPSPTPSYAILSHRWRQDSGQKEIKFKDLHGQSLGDMNDSAWMLSKVKLMAACEKARQASPPLGYIWIDTVCIDKSNSAELSSALNSMMLWYSESAICDTYLFDIRKAAGLSQSTLSGRRGQPSDWFARGWTLQELVAPQTTQFYDQEWQLLGTRDQLAPQISSITGIGIDYLTEPPEKEIKDASVAARMSWMAGRVTGEIEDIAYSLIGVLDVTMTPQYGEGKNAFSRLQETLLTSRSFDESLFAWKSSTALTWLCQTQPWKPNGDRWGLLAPSPDCFAGCGAIIPTNLSPRRGAGFVWSHQGVSFELPWKLSRNLWGVEKKAIELPLNCAREDQRGNKLSVVIPLVKSFGDSWARDKTSVLSEEKKSGKKIDGKVLGIDQGAAAYSMLTVQQPVL